MWSALRYFPQKRFPKLTTNSTGTSRAVLLQCTRSYGEGGRGPTGFPADVSSALCTLGILENASANSENVKKKYKQLVAKFHPDVPGGSDAKMKSVNTAYDVIRKYEEQNGGTLKPCATMYDTEERSYGFHESDEAAFQEQVRRHARGMHISRDDEDAFATFHDFVFGQGMNPNFHTVEFKQRSGRRRKPVAYDEYQYFTSFDDGEADDRYFQENDDYMNNFDDWGEQQHQPPPGYKNQHPQGQQKHHGQKRPSFQNHRSRGPPDADTFYDEYHNDANYQQRRSSINDDEMYYTPNRFYGTRGRRPPQRQRHHQGNYRDQGNHRDQGNFRPQRGRPGERMGHGRGQNRRRSSYSIDDNPIDYM